MSDEKTESPCACTHVTGSTEVNRFHLTYKWKIAKFTHIKTASGKCMTSMMVSPNEDPNIQWILKIYPEADLIANKKFVSLFLEFCPTKSKKEITAKFDIAMIGKQNHAIKSAKSDWRHFNNECGYAWGFSQFIRREDIMNYNKFFPSDGLTIVCNITGQLGIGSLPNRLTNNFMDSERSSTQSEYQKLFENKMLTDIVLTASDGKVLHAHKVVLAAHSPVFLAMFTQNMKETITGEVSIPDVQFDILQEVLRFIYCGKVENMETSVYDLLAVSNKYAIESLKFECEKYLSKNVRIDTIIEVLSLADTYDAANLRKYAIDFFLMHKSDIVSTENFESFGKLQPHTIVELTRELIVHK